MARFKEQVDIRPVDVTSGAAQGALSLANRLESFKSVGSKVLEIGVQKSRQRAIARGKASAAATPIERKDGEVVAPEFKDVGFFGGIEASAHNKALRDSYIASLGNDVRENIARIEAENKSNLVGFNESIKGWAKGMLSGVDQSVRQDLAIKINDRATISRISVQNATIEKQNKEASAQLASSGKTTLNEALTFSSNGDLGPAAEGLLDYGKILNARVDAGFISIGDAQEKMRDAELRATHENLVGNVRRMSNGGKMLDAMNLIVDSQQKIPNGMSVDEHQDLTSAMILELNQGINIRNKLDVESGDVSKEKQSDNYSNLAVGIAVGTTSTNEIIRNMRSGQITEQQFDKLIGTMNKRGQGVDNFQLINLINSEIRQGTGLESTRNTIISNTGTNLTEATSQSLLNDLNAYQDKESILRTSNVSRARDFITPSIRVTGPLGALDMEAEGRLAAAIRNFDTRVLGGEDPWAIADELVGKDRLEREPNPMFGNKGDLKTALEDLNKAFDTAQIDEATYNFEFERIERLKNLISNIETFDKSKKEADANRIK